MSKKYCLIFYLLFITFNKTIGKKAKIHHFQIQYFKKYLS